MDFKPNDIVEIMEQGKWVGPFRVVSGKARTAEHIILQGDGVMFEHYNDFPFNVRPFRIDMEFQDSGDEE